MSYSDGWAALNLEMPARVPRTEYSLAEYHFPLIKRVTGLDVSDASSPAEKARARRAMREAWNFDFSWSTYLVTQLIEKKRTRMGHAVYGASGADKDVRVECPFSTPEEALAFDPLETYGPIDESAMKAAFEAHYRQNVEALPNEVNMTGTYVTLISGLIEIFGWEIMLEAMGDDPAGFGAVANRYADWMMPAFRALAAADVPCVMIHDDIVWTSGAFINPAWYRKYVFPNYARYFAPILESGKKLVYTSDGSYTQFIDDIAQAGAQAFVLEPSTDMAYIAEKYGRTHAFIGNADTRILLSGTPDMIRTEVRRCMDIGKSCPGFIMAVGNHIPANTPIENCLIYEEASRDMSRR
jgi:hypothetical protein